MNEFQIIKKHKEKITELFELYSDKLFAYAFGITRNAQEARDIVADAFLKAAGERRIIEDDFNCRAWLYKVVTNGSRNFMSRFFSKFLNFSNFDLDAYFKSDSNTCDQAIRISEFAGLSKVLEKLDRREKQMVFLKYYEEMTYKEISEITGISEASVATVVSRALRRLKNEF